MKITKIHEGMHVAYTDFGMLYLCKDEEGDWTIQSMHARAHGPKPEYVLAGPYDSLSDAIYAI